MTNSSSLNNDDIFESEDDLTIPSTSCDYLFSMSSTSPKQSPTTARCGLIDAQKKRASLAARRQSNVQVNFLICLSFLLSIYIWLKKSATKLL